MAEYTTKRAIDRCWTRQKVPSHIEMRSWPHVGNADALDEVSQSEVLTPCTKIGVVVPSVLACDALLMEVVNLHDKVWVVVLIE